MNNPNEWIPCKYGWTELRSHTDLVAGMKILIVDSKKPKILSVGDINRSGGICSCCSIDSDYTTALLAYQLPCE